jgi:hypothetical protein
LSEQVERESCGAAFGIGTPSLSDSQEMSLTSSIDDVVQCARSRLSLRMTKEREGDSLSLRAISNEGTEER